LDVCLNRNPKQIKHEFVITIYNLNYPFVFSGRGSVKRKVTLSIPLYDLNLCYHLDVKKTLESKCRLKTVVLPFGFDLNPDFYDAIIEN
jgi:hypothetical protein